MKVQKFNEFITESNDNNDEFKIDNCTFNYEERVDGKRMPYTVYTISTFVGDDEFTGSITDEEGIFIVNWDEETPDNWEEIDELVNDNMYGIEKNVPSL